MAVPRHPHTKSKRNNRRMHIYAKVSAMISCPKCGKSALPHIACQACGFYKGKEAIDVFKKLNKKEKKAKEKEMANKETEDKKKETESLNMESLSKK